MVGNSVLRFKIDGQKLKTPPPANSDDSPLALPSSNHLVFIKKATVFKIRIIHGNPWKRRSNQSNGFIKSPFISIDNFSTICGGKKGASPSVAHNIKTIPQSNLSISDNTLSIRPHYNESGTIAFIVFRGCRCEFAYIQ